MKRILFYALIVVLAAVGLWLYLSAVSTPNVENSADKEKTAEDFLPWVEVYLPGVAVKKSNEVVEHPLKTGDEISMSDTVATDETGLADIHFPDGSVLRLDVSSEFVLSDFKFEDKNNSLGVKIFLTTGRVWSKILSLTGADSFWEVRTGNAVAAVRGTAFGVEYTPGKTFIIGAENEVSVNGVNQENNQPLINNTAIVGPGKILEVLDEDIAGLIANDFRLNDRVRDAESLIWDRDWIKRSLAQDERLDGRVSDLRSGGLPESEVREELKKDNAEEKQMRSETGNQNILNAEENTSGDSVTSTENATSSTESASGDSASSSSGGLIFDNLQIMPLYVVSSSSANDSEETTVPLLNTNFKILKTTVSPVATGTVVY